MNKREAVIRLREKMKKVCNQCDISKSDIDYCFIKCNVYWFTNLMLKEIDGNGCE